MTTEITLRGTERVALVDEEDAAAVEALRPWYVGTHGYVMHRSGPRKNRVTWLLHRFILQAPKGIQVDHRNRFKLDCRRDNLRLATPSQNSSYNPQRIGRSGFRGVWKNGPGWSALIEVRGKRIYLGQFREPEAAALAYDAAARLHNGEFATLNFP